MSGAGRGDGHARLRSAVGRVAAGRDRERHGGDSAGLTELLRRGLGDVAGRTNARLRFVGYTRNERLERRTALVYEDDIGLSAARARRTMETIAAEMHLAPAQVEFEGRGYVHSDDVVNAGFVQGETSHVVVQVVYDEVAPSTTTTASTSRRSSRELTPENAFALNLMRITVDGEPIDDPDRSSADVQRCTDVALQSADIQFGFDNLEADTPARGGRGAATVAVAARRSWAPPVRFRCTRTTRTSSSAPRCGSSSSISRSRRRRSGSSCSARTAPASGCPSRRCSRRRARAQVRAARVRQRRHVRRDRAAAAVDHAYRDAEPADGPASRARAVVGSTCSQSSRRPARGMRRELAK